MPARQRQGSPVMSKVTFRQIPDTIANALLDFASRPNIGKSIDVAGETYTLDYISQNSSRFFQSRGISVYFRVGRSVVRISDHWCQSNRHDRSRKLNCGSISGQFWRIENRDAGTLFWGRYSGAYPWVMLAGRAGLNVLNKTCDHWIEG